VRSFGVTARATAAVLVTPPPVAETVTVELPAGVVGRVVTVMVVEQVGVQEAGAKLAVAPWGRPVAENETACGAPETRVAERERAAFPPWAAESVVVAADTVKSKAGEATDTVIARSVVFWFPAVSAQRI
jgi:hypothetical protein